MTEHASYIISTYASFLSLSEDKLFYIGRNITEDSNPIPSFDEKLLINLCHDATNIFKNEEIMLKIDGNTIVVGDIHGSYHDLLRILKYTSNVHDKIIFLGDYVDRGSFSLECITLLFAFKIKYPEKYYLLRGNHEFDNMCSQYGFKKSILNNHNPKKIDNITQSALGSSFPQSRINFSEKSKQKSNDEETTEMLCDIYMANHTNTYCYKYTENLYQAFLDSFSYLPIAAIVNNTTFCIHGGLSPNLDRIERINKIIKRPIVNLDQNQLLTDLLWSDPSHDSGNRFCENPRGRGKLFNDTAVFTFLMMNNLKRVIRAHECVKDGVEFNFNHKCITVFSASSYDHDLGNKCGIVQLFEKNDRVNSIVFKPFKRLKKFDAIFYKVQSYNGSSISKYLSAHFSIRAMHSSPDGFLEKAKIDARSNYSFNIKREPSLKRVVKSNFSFNKRRRAQSDAQSAAFNPATKLNLSSLLSFPQNDQQIIDEDDNSTISNDLNEAENINDNGNGLCLPSLSKLTNV